MNNSPSIDFEPMGHGHLRLLHGWLQVPHVREFWDDGDRTLGQVRAHYLRARDVEAFIVRLDGQEAGYIQAYPVGAGTDFAACRAERGETWGLDLFIGEVEFVGRGHAAAIIRAFVRRLKGQLPASSACWSTRRPAMTAPSTSTGRQVLCR